MILFPCCGGRAPSGSSNSNNNNTSSSSLSAKIRKSRRREETQFRSAVKILLLGAGESGKSTILKQMKVLHVQQGFGEKERREQIEIIRDNLHNSVCEIIRNVPKLGLTLNESSGQAVLDIQDHLIGIVSEDYVRHVKNLISDDVFQACLRRSNEFQLMDNVSYFLSRIEDICSPDYSPTTDDILRSRKITTGYHEVRFQIKVPKSNYYQEFRMFDVGGQREERTKWIHVFEGIEALLFVISCCDFDQTLREDNTTNRLSESISLFQRVWHNGFLTSAGLICFLNKQDLLEEKIRNGHSAVNFPGYLEFCRSFQLTKGSGNRKDRVFLECERTRAFIKDTLVKVTEDPPRRISNREFAKRECYYHFTTATDSLNIKRVFDNVHVMILNEMLSRVSLM